MAKKKEPEPQSDGAIIPIVEGTQSVVIADSGDLIDVPAWGTPIGECPSSIDMRDQAGFALAFNAVGEPDISLDRQGEAVIDAKHWLIHPCEKVDESTGEVSRFARLVLIDPEGRTFATTSGVVMARLAQLVAYYGGRENWETVRLRVIERTAKRSGRRYHDLRIVPIQEGE